MPSYMGFWQIAEAAVVNGGGRRRALHRGACCAIVAWAVVCLPLIVLVRRRGAGRLSEGSGGRGTAPGAYSVPPLTDVVGDLCAAVADVLCVDHFVEAPHAGESAEAPCGSAELDRFGLVVG